MRIILIETSAALCSVALSEDGAVTAVRTSSGVHEHAAMTAPFVKEVLEERGLKVSDCSAVCVSSGPGSYTGLRVGSSTAKGLCFGAGIPLLAVRTTDILVDKAIREGLLPEGCTAIVPMIDARRMEVYSAVYSPVGEMLEDVRPTVVEQDSFSEIRANGPVLFIGDGAAKCAETLASPGSVFINASPTAADMAAIAEKRFAARTFEDIAYFEPFYLKDFIATTPKRKLF